jgi:hypothetical protein
MPRNPGGTVSGFKLLSTPDAPTITGVTTSIGSASVAFTAPTDTGDGAISSYVVTAVNESSGVSTGVSGASSPITHFAGRRHVQDQDAGAEPLWAGEADGV